LKNSLVSQSKIPGWSRRSLQNHPGIQQISALLLRRHGHLLHEDRAAGPDRRREIQVPAGPIAGGVEAVEDLQLQPIEAGNAVVRVFRTGASLTVKRVGIVVLSDRTIGLHQTEGPLRGALRRPVFAVAAEVDVENVLHMRPGQSDAELGLLRALRDDLAGVHVHARVDGASPAATGGALHGHLPVAGGEDAERSEERENRATVHDWLLVCGCLEIQDPSLISLQL